MEDVSVRAITIGVGVLIAMMTITAVLSYYNTAKEAVRDIGSGTDIAGLYDKSIEDILLKSKVTGTDVKNILNYFSGRTDVRIYVTNLQLFLNSYDVVNGMPEIKTDYTYTHIDGIQVNNTETNNVIKFILPNSTYSLNTYTSGGITTIKIN